jgi:hypothetical protein
MLKGFNTLIPQRLVKIFSPFEFDFLLSGQSVIDLKDWMSNTVYKGNYTEKHPVLIYLILDYKIVLGGFK